MKRHFLLSGITGIFLIFILACTQKSDNYQDVEYAIQKGYDLYIESVAQHDLDGLMSVWDENGLRSEPGLPTIIGKENIRARFKELFAMDADVLITPVGKPLLEVCNGFAFTYRTVTLTTIPRDSSGKIVSDMNVLSIFKKQEDGSWKAYIDCVNYHPTWSMDSIPEGMQDDNPYY